MDLKIFKKKHMMFDLETMSTHQNAAIVSIGAVIFTFESGITNKFEVNVDLVSCKNAGMHFKKETIDWWATQPKETRQRWQKNPVDIKVALEKLTEFHNDNAPSYVWAKGITFDIGIVKSAYEHFEMAVPWMFWNEIDARTVMTIFNSSNTNAAHSALEDSIAQAEFVINLFRSDSNE